MLNRNSVMKQAIHDCYVEMYAKAQPSLDFDQLTKDLKNGVIKEDKKSPIYTHHYLSKEEFKYIEHKYQEAYRFKDEWTSNINFLLNNLKDGGMKNVYKKHEDGMPYRSGEKTPSIYNMVGKDLGKEVIQLIEDLRDFYKFDEENIQFGCSIALGSSPTSNAETVKAYWKSQGKDIEIEERDPDTFWYRDMYGDEWETIYKEEMYDI